ncbi:cupin domain-containing protein [Pseudoalteromonas sp. T1lg88]|uniref:cupin domain-containing protein n=1 Tax=Pseudoalteromonas sp. T1lg88 TaxID=2077104 RepID=UPI000CF5FF8C|nr:cupin domain-containing protein [Pseudoalteromonas sp. T1lg88]
MKPVNTENTEHYTWGDNCDGWHLVKSTNLSVIQECVPPGCEEVSHYHEHAEQFFFVLSGIATIEVDGKEYELHPQQGIHIPSQTPHQLKNKHEEHLCFIVTSTPPSHGDRVLV